jgi:5-methylcytosine-specific restriction endonuclease McrBC regulatory subunit McrC
MNIPFEGNIAYRVREYSYDNNITELIRHTIEHLKTSVMGSAVLTADPDIRSDVQKIINYTPSYNKNNRCRIINANRKALQHPYFTEYLPLQRLCLQLLRYEKVSFGAEKDKIYGLIFDGAWIWEEYLNTLLASDFSHPNNKTKEGREYLFCDDTGKEMQEIYPDFIGWDKGIIADAKYKHLESHNHKYRREDYFQIITYMYRFHSNHGFLLFPHQEHPFCKNYTIKDNKGRLTILGLAIPQQEDSFKDFCEQMRKNEKNFKNMLKSQVSKNN